MGLHSMKYRHVTSAPGPGLGCIDIPVIDPRSPHVHNRLYTSICTSFEAGYAIGHDQTSFFFFFLL